MTHKPKIIIACLAFLLPSQALAQTEERVAKARDEINLVENAANRAVYACERKHYASGKASPRLVAIP